MKRVIISCFVDIQQVDIDMEKQTVTVTTDLDKDIVLSHIKKSGKVSAVLYLTYICIKFVNIVCI